MSNDKDIREKLHELAKKYDLPSITTWKQGHFIDSKQYRHMRQEWKDQQEVTEQTLIRPHGGTNNALFQVGARGFNGPDITAYLEEVGDLLSQLSTERKDHETR